VINHEGNSKVLRTVKLIYASMVIAIMVYAGILYGFSIDISDDIVLDQGMLNQITIAAAALGAVCLVCGYFVPKWMINTINKQKLQSQWKKSYPPNMTPAETALLNVFVMRAAMFEAVAVFGLVLGILGVDWQFTLPFFIAPAVAIVLTFPNEEKWKQTLDKFNEYITSNTSD
jgi:hypothetical protein